MNNSSEPNREKELFSVALELPAAERAAFLDRECAGDEALRQRLEDLLRVHGGADRAFPTEPGDRTEIVQLSEGPGTQIGKYKLLEQIGEGGMGAVYMAEQDGELVRRVALKIIKLGMDTKAVVARFEAERQALALMNHPNIAKVLDAGATDTGRPYFVMELVKGMPITEYCDKRKLNTQERLELFIPVCQAIQHAHQKGIIHRDIKPSNVLVAHFDGKPMPMVIDFGIAKATHQRLTEKTVFTRHGQFMGTLEYIAPEQAEGSQLDIDTRADVYSLGVLLYQLLTGSTPFPGQRLREAGWEKMMKILQEEDPPRPSTRVSTMSNEELSTMEGTHGGEAPNRISLLLRRELDWIVMRCLAKDRSERYETANGLAMDIGRYLRGDAPEAAPPTWSYQFSKLARKHKKTFAMAAVIAGILSVATVFSSYQAVLARRAKDTALAAENLATTRADKLAAFNGWMTRNFLPQVNPWTGFTAGQKRDVDIKLKDAILQSVENLSQDLKDQPAIEGEIRLTVGIAFERMGLRKEAETNVFRAYDLLNKTLGGEHTNTMYAQWKLGEIIAMGEGNNSRTARAREAVNLMESAFDTATRTLGETNAFTLQMGLDTGATITDLGLVEEAESLIPRLAAHLGLPDGRAKNYPFFLWMWADFTLNWLRIHQGRVAEANRLTRMLYEESQLQPEFTNDISYADRVLQGRSSSISRFWNRDYSEAVKDLDRAIAISTNAVGSGFPTAQLFMRRGALELDLGDWHRAPMYYRQSVAHWVASFGPEHPYTIANARSAASIPASLADWNGAAEELRRQREELKFSNGISLGLEALVTHLSGAANEANRVQSLFFQNIRTNTSKGYAADLSPMLAIMALPVPSTEISQLAAKIKETIDSQGEYPWFKRNHGADVLAGMLAYRSDDPKRAIGLLESFVAETGRSRNTLPLMYMLAMAHRKAEEPEKASSWFKDAEQLLDELLKTGFAASSAGDWDWEPMARAPSLRVEAEGLLGLPVSPMVDIAALSGRREAQKRVKDLIEAGLLLARKRHYLQAVQKFQEATNSPAFQWDAMHQAFGFSWKLFGSYWGLGDSTNQIRILEKMHEGMGEKETTFLYNLAEVPWNLPPGLEVRRRESRARQRLNQKWADPKQKLEGEEPRILGMCLYRESTNSNYEQCLELFKEDMKSSRFRAQPVSRAFSAMALWKLNRRDEAREMLKQADEHYFKTVIEPGEGMYPPDFPACIAMEQIIKEADVLIDGPDVVNAPHVAALGDEGWPGRLNTPADCASDMRVEPKLCEG